MGETVEKAVGPCPWGDWQEWTMALRGLRNKQTRVGGSRGEDRAYARMGTHIHAAWKGRPHPSEPKPSRGPPHQLDPNPRPTV